MSGPVDTSGARLSTSGLATTDMGCDKERHDQDTWLSGVLSSKPEWKYDASTLTLKSGTTEILLDAKPPAALEGTTWVADTILDKDVARPLQAPAWIVLADGAVQAGDGCNSAQGRYQATPEKITFREVASTMAACPQADEVLPVLDGDVAYTVQDETLTLKHLSGAGLQLKAGTIDEGLADKQFVSADGKTRLTFADGKLTAGVGCNDLTGAAAVANGKLVVPHLSRTRKACEPALMEQEDKLVDLLKSTPQVQVTDTGLLLRASTGELAFRTG
jgi:heat shock protein HslJ